MIVSHKKALCLAVLACNAGFIHSVTAQEDTLEEVLVVAQAQVFGNNVVTEGMLNRESTMTSINGVIDSLPGVSIQEGDAYGFDDWSTSIVIRGFQTNLDEQQIGTTIDGLPNGNSNYGGGAKANRYIDSGNMGQVDVSQGTADIASRSTEALGGTINFTTDSPADDQRIRVQLASGDFDAKRVYVRYDTGEFAGDTRAWISASRKTATDWVNQSAENEGDHVAAKIVSGLGSTELTGYVSYDSIHEDNYQRLFSAADFANHPDWDGLTADWTNTPYINQVYRRGWSTVRRNVFGYFKFDTDIGDAFNVGGALYHHKNNGHGDWIPPYLVDVTADAGGHSEFLGGKTAKGGSPLGSIYFVDKDGNALAPIAGCQSSITFPYGGAGAAYDPECYAAGAIPVQSFRHTHYEKERTGLTLDGQWELAADAFTNTLRGGVWYEDTQRDESRDWHKLTDARVGIAYDFVPYWIQYDISYPQETLKWYLEDSFEVGPVTLSLGVKQFLVDVDRKDRFDPTTNVSISSDSDVLFSGGFLWLTPLDGLEVFGGYAENFKAISDLVLERPASDLDKIEPETAENMELGVRYRGDRVFISATYYEIEFDNRIIFLSNETASGPNYLIGTNGSYFNAGGIESSGVEITADVDLTDATKLYVAYTFADSEYLGTGDAAVDTAVGVTPGNTVVGIAENQLVVSLDWAQDQFIAGASLKYTDDRFVDLANTWVADNFTTVDAYVGVIGEGGMGGIEGWDIKLQASNLFDESHLGGISGGGAWIGTPRTISIAVTADF